MANLSSTLAYIATMSTTIRLADGTEKEQFFTLEYILNPNTRILELPKVQLFAQHKVEDSRNFYQSVRDLSAIGLLNRCMPMSADRLVYIGRAIESNNCINHVSIKGDANALVIFILNNYPSKSNVYSKSSIEADLNALKGAMYTPKDIVIKVSSGGRGAKAERATISLNKSLMASLGIELE